MHDPDKPNDADQLTDLALAHERIAALEAAQEEYRRSGQRALELAIDQVKAAALKSFLSNLAGFVTAPLTVLKASVLSLRNIPAEAVQQEQWQMLEDQIATLERLFDNMLLMVRLDHLSAIDRAPENLSQIAQQVVDRFVPLAAQRRHTLSFHPQADGPDVLADPFLLKCAIGAIVANAMDFTPPGGSIRVVTYTQDQTEAVLEVRDNGIGIDPDDRPHIFKRFWWANRADYPSPGSIGLGLALAKRIIDLHDGRIDVESARNQGSTFWVILPVHAVGM